jgi:murein DD-endopeptidase MepM/ murein hydrolase activator NlpD
MYSKELGRFLSREGKMKFFNKAENGIINGIGNKRSGCYPVSNTGMWHSGIHVYFENEEQVIENPIEGKIVAADVDSKKDWNYFVLENEITFPVQSDNKKKEGFHCYNFISNLKTVTPYDDLLGGKENAMNKENLDKIKDLPYYIKAKIKLPSNTCGDSNNYKIFFVNRSKSKIVKDTKTDVAVSGLNKSNLSVIEDYCYIKAGTEVHTANGLLLGTIKDGVSVKSEAVTNDGGNCSVELTGDAIALSSNMPTGYYVKSTGEKINGYANLQVLEKGNLAFWKETSAQKSNGYPGFGLVIKKENGIWKGITEDAKIPEETKKRIDELLTSINDTDGCVFVVPDTERNNIFPYILDRDSKNAYEIVDDKNTILKPLSVSETEYGYFNSKLTGFFKGGEFYKWASDLWNECNAGYIKYEKIAIGKDYGGIFEYVKVIDEGGNDITQRSKVPAAVLNSFFFKARPYLLQSSCAQKYKISSNDVYERVINISDRNALYKYNEIKVKNGYPSIDSLGKAEGEIEMENASEIVSDISVGSNSIWVRSKGSFIYIPKNIYTGLKFALSKTNPVKGDLVPTYAKLGFPFSGHKLEQGEISAMEPYIDYALFFADDITTQKTTLKKLTVDKDTPAFERQMKVNKTEDILFVPPWASMDVAQVPEVKGYVRINKIYFDVYAYPGQVKNKKLKQECSVIWICNFPVNISGRKCISVGSRFPEKSNTNGEQKKNDLIINAINEILQSMMGEVLKDVKCDDKKPAGEDNVMYKYEAVLDTGGKTISADFKRDGKSMFLETFKTEENLVPVTTPDDFTEIITSDTILETEIKGTKYTNIQIKDTMYYIENANVTQEDLLADFRDSCRTINFGKQPLAKSDVCPSDKLVIDDSKLDDFRTALWDKLNTIKTDTGEALSDYVYKSGDEIERSDNAQNDEDDHAIYNRKKEYGTVLDLYLKKTVSRHPIEWDESKCDKNICKERGIAPFSSDTDCDVYKGLHAADSTVFSKNEFYFACPTYFYNRMEETGLLFKNPYEGKTYNDIYNTGNGGCGDISMDTKIVDNPGFAPVYDGIKGRENVGGYAGINGFFNENYLGVHSKYKEYWHEGVDFAGVADTPIKSFVFGEVIDVGTHKNTHDTGTGMGDYMLVRDGKDSNKYYLLLHLSWNSWEKYGVHIGTKVYPGMTVAGVGTQEPVVAYHLHVSVIMLNSGEVPIPEKLERLALSGKIRDESYSFPIWDCVGDKNNLDRFRNPFDHSKTWKGRYKK